MREHLLKFGILMGIVGCICMAQPASGQTLSDSQLWQGGSGEITLELRGDYLPDFGIEILRNGRMIDDRRSFTVEVDSAESLGIRAPWGIFGSLATGRGRLEAVLDLTWNRGLRSLNMGRVQFRPGHREGHPILVAEDREGNTLFTLSHIHLSLHPERGRMNLANAEIEASAFVAEQLDFPGLAGMPIGMATLDLALAIPEGAEIAGTPPGCGARPIWPQAGDYQADVTLTGMSNVVYQGTEPGTGRVKITPSARLKNESLADIPWIAKFSSYPGYPYTPADQHPYLVWNMYKIDDGRIRMLGGSGVKHAFFTINVNCDLNCGSGSVLWPGCEDVYAASTNDSPSSQGPRSEIEASVGIWTSCNSFFDPDCDDAQEGSSGQWLNRLLVDPTEFQAPGAEYFLDGWYVIQYDRDIWNSMGYRTLDPAPSSSGWLMNPGAFTQGPVIGEWVPEAATDPASDHDVITVDSSTSGEPYPDNMPEGHLRLLVKVTETEPGRYRYNYALQNYDFDRGLEAFRINIPVASQIFESAFFDIDDDAGNDWAITVADDHVLFEATAGNELDWFELFNFEIVTDAQPVNSPVTLELGADSSKPQIDVMTLGPASGTGLLFEDRFSGF